MWSCDSLLAEGRSSDWKVACSSPGRSSRGIFFSRVNFVCCLLFVVYSIPVLPQWHTKDPVILPKLQVGRLHLNMQTPWTQWSLSGLIMPQSRHSEGTYEETSSQATSQGTQSHSHLNSLSHCGLIWLKEWNYCAQAISTLKKKKNFNVQAGNE